MNYIWILRFNSFLTVQVFTLVLSLCFWHIWETTICMLCASLLIQHIL